MDRNSCDGVRYTPVRRIQPTRRSVSGVHAFRGETAVPYESTLERDLLIRLEFQRDVLDVVAQPVEIPFSMSNGRFFTYTPDFLVYFRLGDRSYLDYPRPLLIEVKPRSEWRAHWRDWLPKWKAAYRLAREKGWIFHVFDESRIRDVRLENIRFLERYERMQFPPEEGRQVFQTLGGMGGATVDYLLARHFTGPWRAEGLALIWHLLATRQIDCDIARPLNHATEVWVPGHE